MKDWKTERLKDWSSKRKRFVSMYWSVTGALNKLFKAYQAFAKNVAPMKGLNKEVKWVGLKE